MSRVQDNHLGRPPRLSAGLDYTGKGVESLHERYRSRRDAAARELLFGRTNWRQIAAGPGAPFEEHAFRLRQVEDRAHRVFNGVDETGRALRLRFNSAVEPHGGVESHHLIQQQMNEFVMEDRGVLFACEVTALASPLSNSGRHPADQLARAGFTFRTSLFAVEIFGGNDVRCGHGPAFGYFD